MLQGFSDKGPLFAPTYHEVARNGRVILIDPEAPHWVATDTRGARIMGYLDGRKNLDEVIADYCRDYGVDWAKGWLHCRTFLQDAFRSGFLSRIPFSRAPYPGRSEVLQLEHLSELWLHLTNACNLSCSHCLVDSSPAGMPGEGADFWHQTIDQGFSLGVTRFYITGGEPFLRPDIFDIIDFILPRAELTILTNAILLQGRRLKRLSRYDPNRLSLQISLDGPRPEINDTIRGRGSFDAALRGIKEAINIGFYPTLTVVVTRSNINHIIETAELAASLGIKKIHLLISHSRGRARGSQDLTCPLNSELFSVFHKTQSVCNQTGIALDNFEALRMRLLGRNGVKADLSSAAYGSLLVYADGEVYPSAALAGIPELRMGSLSKQSLEEIWRNSQVADMIRKGTVQKKAKCKDCHLKYLCGGGDIEHTYLHSGQFLGEDPFSEFYERWIIETLFAIAGERAKRRTPSGYDRPILLAAMGEDALLEEDQSGINPVGGFEVSLSPSACVLSVDPDKSRRIVQDFYGEAAKSPQPQLCCPGGYPKNDTAHIPKEVLEIAYGCGSPMGLASIQPGEVVVDLGAGGGIDCFIAAKKVGPTGKVVGIDMTEAMLARADWAKGLVAANLGYDVVTFKSGYLERIPLPPQSADLVTSNCVINLSPDKRHVFFEIWRILKDLGRIVISDTVSEKPIPEGMKGNPRLWGECVSGALTEEEYLAFLERAGFYGISVLKKNFWREVEGYRFYSMVIRGYKFEKKAGCRYIGQRAVYLGPMQAVVDEEGHLFPRNQQVDVCIDTAAKLKKPPYTGSFLVIKGVEIDQVIEADAVSDEGACHSTESCC
ncbi:MAG: methyltransferase domain-containing protein [Nitrospirae bacterium]|nr:methyltransferase domain-containing protein [Nitrospirota bacterium]